MKSGKGKQVDNSSVAAHIMGKQSGATGELPLKNVKPSTPYPASKKFC